MIKKLFLFVLLLPIANLESHEFNPAHLIINQNNNEGAYWFIDRVIGIIQ